METRYGKREECKNTTRSSNHIPGCYRILNKILNQLIMTKYSKKAQEYVKENMKEMESGKLKSSSGQKVTNPKQAIAIGLSEAREDGLKVPKKAGSRNKKSTR